MALTPLVRLRTLIAAAGASILRSGPNAEDLLASDERFQLVFEGSDQLFFFAHGTDHRFTYLSPSVETVLGYTPGELLGRPFEILHPGDPSDEQVQELTRFALATGASQCAYVAINRRKDGRIVPVEIVESPIVRGGEVMGLHGFARDISGRVRTERALQESEAQLRQAQKMEAVGRLAGGVAHDFNNIMTAIIGHADFLLDGLAPGDPLGEDARQIRRSADRAAALVRQLLAFGRQQHLTLEALDLNEVVRGTTSMLRRTIGDDIRLHVELGEHLAPMQADRSQMEQVLVNLMLNARDAMPDGGELTVRTAGAECAPETADDVQGPTPGCFAVLSVRDTGCGMTPEVRTRMFDPFFTTKEAGQASGLGLSTVYGIVKQSGGHLQVDSAPDEGTTVHVYLPCSS